MDKVNQVLLVSCFGAMIYLEFIGHTVPTTIALVGGFFARHLIGEQTKGS